MFRTKSLHNGDYRNQKIVKVFFFISLRLILQLILSLVANPKISLFWQTTSFNYHDLSIFWLHFLNPPVHITKHTGYDCRHHPQLRSFFSSLEIDRRGFDPTFEVNLIRLAFECH